MTVNLKYIEAVCNSYNDIDDQRFCFLLHHLGQGINLYRPAIIKHNSSNEEKFWPRLSATIK